MINISTIKPEFIFLFFCLIFGSIIAVISPPFLVPDEIYHFIKAFDVSQGHLMPENNIVNIPKTVLNITHSYNNFDMLKTTYISDLNKHLNINDKQELNISNMYHYTPITYLAVAFVIKIGGLFDLSPLLLMYLGRFINLYIYCLLVYFGIKIAPIGKYMFLLLALTPMSLYISSSISADSLNLALSFFTICLFLNLAFKEDKVHKKDIILVSICILALILSKQIYALIALLFFIIPKNKFRNMKNRIIYFIYIILPAIIATIFWNYLFKSYATIDTTSHLSNILLTNPLEFLTMLINSLIYFDGYVKDVVTWILIRCLVFLLCVELYVKDVVTWIPNQLTLPIPLFLIVLYLTITLFVSILDISNFKLKLKQKAIFLMVFSSLSMIIFLIATGWTPSGSPIILGVQGRYFTSILPLFFLIFYNIEKITNYFSKEIINKLFKLLNVFVIASIVIMLSISTYILYETSILSMFIN